MSINVWDEITFPFQNFNGATADVWEGTSNFIPLFIMDVITLLGLKLVGVAVCIVYTTH